MNRHRYTSLAAGASVRILTLDPGQACDSLRGTLNTVPIESAGSYEAVSYVWADAGPRDSAYEILLRNDGGSEGRLALRGGSIFAALQRLRLSDRPRRIWADQCCINQDDPVEKSRQVQIMSSVFQSATRVMVWLGMDSKNEAAMAFALVHHLDKLLRDPSMNGELRGADTTGLEHYVQEYRALLQALTDRPWFKRGWVAQEIGTSTPATMMWGDATIEWDTLATVCERLKKYHQLRSSLQINTSDVCFLHRRFIEPDESTHHANRFNFVYELQRSRHLCFSDDRDRIFAFLGHFSLQSLHRLSCGPLSIKVDYTKTVEETYIDVLLTILRSNPATLDIVLASVQHARQSLLLSEKASAENDVSIQLWLEDRHRMPSWCPDWRSCKSIILAEPICPHRAHGDTAVCIDLIEGDYLTLRAHGIMFDVIESCSSALLSRDFYKQSSDSRTPTIVEKLWHESCMKGEFNLDDLYPNGDSAFFAFMQTLSNGCVQTASHERSSYHNIHDSAWLQMAARYLAETMGTSAKISAELRSAAGMLDGESDRTKWSRWATSASEGRVFAKTAKGYYVLGPAALEKGDIACVLFGAKVPFCLRPVGKRYLLVGECYVHGLMKGEVMEMLAQGELREEIFEML